MTMRSQASWEALYNGDIVLVHDFDGYPMGRGFINTNSKIAVRMLTRDEHTEINRRIFQTACP